MRYLLRKNTWKFVVAPRTRKERVYFVDCLTAQKLVAFLNKYERIAKLPPSKASQSNLRKTRVALGLTQTALAELSGVDQGYISALETGRKVAGKQVTATLNRALRNWRALLRGAGTPSASSI